MTMLDAHLSEAAAFAAFAARDRRLDGRFVIGVKSTRIYCKPSCPARRPRPENVVLFADAAAALEAGYRACMRCRPDAVGRDREAVAEALRLIQASDVTPLLADVAAAVGYAPHHFQRLFTRDIGVSPAAYARQLRAARLVDALDRQERITDAIYDAGYQSPGHAYADARRQIGMTPSAWRNGGADVVIHYAVVSTSLGALLVAATDKGLCRISFDEDVAALHTRFPRSTIRPGEGDFTALVDQVVSLVDDPARNADLPMDVAGTAFQQAVWAALRAIPAGETRTYKQIAAEIGKPSAIRAAGTACGDNGLAVLIPCHRVVRSDGGLGGYAYGLPRKELLLARERKSNP